MKKILLIIILTNLFAYNIGLANNIAEEPSVKNAFKECYNIAFIENNPSKYNIAIDYSIEILKKCPNSFEAVFTVNCINKITLPGNQEFIQKKYTELFLNYYDKLTNLRDNIPEKLVLSTIFYHGTGNPLTIKEADQHFETGQKFLTQIKDSTNLDYAPLACLLLGYTNPKSGACYYKEFKEKFNKHSAIPFVEMYIIYTEYCLNQKNYSKAIELLNNLILKNNIMTPLGHIKLDYYEMIIQCYIEANDLDNAKKYLEKIKFEVPNYWNIKNIESEIKRLFKN